METLSDEALAEKLYSEGWRWFVYGLLIGRIRWSSVLLNRTTGERWAWEDGDTSGNTEPFRILGVEENRAQAVALLADLTKERDEGNERKSGLRFFMVYDDRDEDEDT